MNSVLRIPPSLYMPDEVVPLGFVQLIDFLNMLE
jgi:hypothetical protein